MKKSTDQLSAARLALESCREQGIMFAASISDLGWSLPSGKGGWSPSECFEHLNLTTSAMLPLFENGAQQARGNQWTSTGQLTVSLVPTILRWLLEPPYRMKTATQPTFLPRRVAGKSEVLKAWNELHSALDRFIRDNAELALDRPRITSPFDPKGRVRYSVYAGLLILAAHERRHLWQASLNANKIGNRVT